MKATLDDISSTTNVKSDQLNNVDLLSGPIVVQILDAKITLDEKQPVALVIPDRQDWKPCKNMRRILMFAWTKSAKNWIGKSVRLYRDPLVTYGSDTTGGIRIEALSDIAKPFEITLQERRGKNITYKIGKLDTPAGTKSEPPKQDPKPDATSVTTEGFKAMKAAWQAGAKAIGGTVNEATFRAFVDTTTGGLVSAAGAMNPQSYSVATLAKCHASALAMMPSGDEKFE